MTVVAIVAGVTLVACVFLVAMTADHMHKRTVQHEAQRFRLLEVEALEARVAELTSRVDEAESEAAWAADAVRKAGLVKGLGRR